MNHTPEPSNAQRPPEPDTGCKQCKDVLVAQHTCTCTESCGTSCWYVAPDVFVPPPVPRFR